MVQKGNDDIGTHPGPSFIFVGPSKAGSSWFFEILREHPQVFVPPNKATFFFSDYYAQGLAWYESFFDRADHARVPGEICHDYLASPEALQRIHDYRPDMRLICCLRNPYARALSSWRFFGRNGMDQPTLAAQGETTPTVFEQGNYASQLTTLYSFFPKNQLLIFFFEDIATDPERVVRDLYEFVGVDPAFRPPSLRTRVNVNAKPRSRKLARLVQYVHEQSWKRSRMFSNFIGQIKRIRPLRSFVRAALYKEPLHSSDWRDHLAEFPEAVIARYEWEIRELERIVGRDLPEWHARTVDADAITRPAATSDLPPIITNTHPSPRESDTRDAKRHEKVADAGGWKRVGSSSAAARHRIVPADSTTGVAPPMAFQESPNE